METLEWDTTRSKIVWKKGLTETIQSENHREKLFKKNLLTHGTILYNLNFVIGESEEKVEEN